ncbi:MAG: hemerythrin domain-containing protein [Caulobacterales bacterium]|nr:hemerythrin domain-containing protein [Caulobacterales bacterium]
MSDLALHARSGLPGEMLCLLAERPRETWSDPTLPETARFWLQMHEGFRRQQATLIRLIGEGALDPRSVHPPLVRTLNGFLGHLDGHHRVETGHYFPAFRRAEPRVAEGLDLLDRDHDTIHGHLEALHGAGLAFHQAITTGAGGFDELGRLNQVLGLAGPALARHLDDEEEIVIPLLALHGERG